MLLATDVFSSISRNRASGSETARVALPSTEFLMAERRYENALLLLAARSGNDVIFRMLLKQPLAGAVHDRVWTRVFNLEPAVAKLPLPMSLSASFSGTSLEHRLFHRFQYCTIPVFAGNSSADFWRLVLRIAQDESAIRSAILTLGALHEHCQDRKDEFVPDLVKDWNIANTPTSYLRAISNLNQRLNVPSKVNATLAIIASILFLCIEGLGRNDLVRLQYIVKRLALIEEMPVLGYPGLTFGILEDLLRVFMRYDVRTNMITSQQKFEPKLIGVSRPSPILNAIPLDIDELVIATHHFIDSHFHKRRYWKREGELSEPQKQHKEAINTLNAWAESLDDHYHYWLRLSRVPSSPLAVLIPLGGLLRIILLRIVLKLCIDCEEETSFEMFRTKFENAVAKVSRTNSWFHMPIASTECGFKAFRREFELVDPLFVVAIRCRDWVIRRRAVNQLRHAGDQGALEASILATLAIRFIQLEEAGLLEGSEIPVLSSNFHLKFSVNYEQRRIHFETTKASDKSWKNFTVHKESISF